MVLHKKFYKWYSKFKPGIRFKYSYVGGDSWHIIISDHPYRDPDDIGDWVVMCADRVIRSILHLDIIFKDDNT